MEAPRRAAGVSVNPLIETLAETLATEADKRDGYDHGRAGLRRQRKATPIPKRGCRALKRNVLRRRALRGICNVMPRQTIKTPELVAEILERISNGEPLAAILREEGKPHQTTWNEWLLCDESLAIAHGRAREAGFDAIALQALDIADDKSLDTKVSKDGQLVPDNEWISRSRLRVETRLKLLAKWDPKRYGDKLGIGQAEGLEPVSVHMIERRIVDNTTD